MKYLLLMAPLLLGADEGSGWSVPALVAGIAACSGAVVGLWQLVAVGRAVGRLEQRLDQLAVTQIENKAALDKLSAAVAEQNITIVRLQEQLENVKATSLRAFASRGP